MDKEKARKSILLYWLGACFGGTAWTYFVGMQVIWYSAPPDDVLPLIESIAITAVAFTQIIAILAWINAIKAKKKD